MGHVVELKGIVKSFGSKVILRDVSLSLMPGEIVGLLGRSGSGKSTLIKILVGYYHADAGQILFNGMDVTDNYKGVRHFVGYTTQDNSFYEKLTVEENMKYYALLYGVESAKQQARIDQLLRAVGLFEHAQTLAGRISGGMKRRLDFAISLLHSPKLVVLDEPTTGLDPFLVETFWKTVTDIVREEKITVLVSSHHLHEIKAHCSRVLFMKEGRLGEPVIVRRGIKLEELFNTHT